MSEKLGAERQTHTEWLQDLEALDMEIVRLAVICQVRLLDPGVIGHVLNQQSFVCGSDHPLAFQSLRGLLHLHFDMQKQLAEAYGAVDAEQLLQQVRAHLIPRIGEQLEGLFHRPSPGTSGN